ncbi:MAG: cytochrome P450 [Cyanobacteria bacterium M_surface_10_m1_298]|nr:cytochrome P450 [Cyanobacteria bacterium M_surface_10_m1_298]
MSSAHPTPTPDPIYPKAAPYSANFAWRLIRGLRSWLDLLSDVDFHIPVGAVRCLGLQLFLVNEPTTVKRVLVDDVAQFPKHPFTLWILEPLIGHAIFSVNGAEWARQRRLVDQAFQVAQLRRVLPQMQGAVTSMLQRLDAALVGADDHPACVEIDQEMTLVTADVIVRTILTRPLRAAEAADIFGAFARYQRRAGQALIARLLGLPQRWLQVYLGRHARIIRQWIDKAIAERLQGPPVRGDRYDLLQALVEAQDPETGSRFDREELLDQVCFLFLAGHETSASALGMAAYLLAHDADVQERFRQEVTLVCADPSEPLGVDHLRRMVFGAAVFNETLRLYPPVSFFIRESLGEDRLVGQRCPMRSLVTISPWVVHRQQGQWPEPHAFRPERFLADACTDQDRWRAKEVWLPFGLGPRKCPGAAFALQEALLVLAELVRRYELLPAPVPAPQLVARLTLRSRNGIKVQLRPLSPRRTGLD